MPIVKQLTILLQNNPGALSNVCSDLASKDINILAMSVLDTIDSGLIRMVVDDHENAVKALGDAGLNVIETDVLSLEMTHKPGTLAEITRQLSKAKINIEYAYVSVPPGDGTSIGIFWVSNLKKATEILEA
ncbi:MAG: amino acid-binding protein [Candidatus Brocadiaceae bacterium]|nr:amino acid-binding protein [Candidatus Brocadiaceae bacterium]